MKKFGILLAFALIGSFAFAQNGNNGQAQVTAIQVSAGTGDLETVSIRISGQGANQVASIGFYIDGMRAVMPQMTKTSGSNGNGNNGTSEWIVNIDLDQYADANGDVTAELQANCCIAIQALQVKSKKRG